ncbi:MAG TPA: hypothetical protein VGD01_10835 [Candidatus Elarobacter sp.]|jgi:hypothetical protein
MLNEFVRRLGAGKADRRGAERQRKRYPIAWLKDGVLMAAIGLEISEKGLLFASHEAPPGPHVDVAIDLGKRRVRARVKIARQGTMAREGTDWAIIAGVFEGIAADDWDAVVRFCKNLAEPVNRGADELAAHAAEDDDAYRLLPLRIQERVVAVLVGAGRLAPGSSAKNPLLRMSYQGKSRTGAHRLAVHSRRVVDGEKHEFDSVLTVDDAGNVQLEG